MNDHDSTILDDSIADPETARRIDEFLNDPSTGVTRERSTLREFETEGIHLVQGTPLNCLLCDSPATKVTTADHYTAHPLNGGFKGICVMVTCTSCEGMFELHLENQPEGVVIVPVGY